MRGCVLIGAHPLKEPALAPHRTIWDVAVALPPFTITVFPSPSLLLAWPCR